ncbi:NADP-dependent 3-hydroxy acid dehydrogenase YdfG [Pseudoclavibacter sp. JAI123]|uniref:SDR family oxidoreductase n=1 Tax=Pseudoclavibacter sp. JAI123 TaxID=2723065 RepID=UPI0015C939CC|nr:SDR family oxidoreductase [Pseudoclavibacter sp. JAI123]NYF13357.1 NADP-dependent 3-hydroxy acid dehydrogenase YdfG [Pseudoclavibacter sp. JAI123]
MPEQQRTRVVVVTGASSGIGRSTVRSLRAAGRTVLATARRADRLDELAAETGAEVLAGDITSDAFVAELRDRAAQLGVVEALVNVAGGAFGTESVEESRIDDWQRMFDLNVLGTKRVITALLPLLRASAASSQDEFPHADIVTVTSTAGRVIYQGGGGYVAVKAAEAAMIGVLRLELGGEPIRVIDIAPGMVHTDEFTLKRMRGDEESAAKLYEGVDHPLTADDIAATIQLALQLPGHVNVDELIVRPVAQREQFQLHRGRLEMKDTAKESSE